jgi:hypothetical protein
MPEVDFQASTELENILQRSARKRKQLPEFYGARVLLAANLASLMAELHELGHYMVDLKPMNMRFYPHAWYMAILDTDGFSIGGPGRLPARQFSDEYIAPEARGKKPEQLGAEQDLFALAVIIFRLLNNGIHPYQGVDRGNHPTTLQERIFAGLYAYGLTPHSAVQPAPSSIHDFLESRTRSLFDRAFRAAAPRPAASEWRDHLKGLITQGALVKCAAHPREHAHFSLGCGLCQVEQKLATTRARQSFVRPTPVQSSGGVLTGLATGTPSRIRSGPTQPTLIPTYQYPSPPLRRSSSWSPAKITAALAAVVTVTAIYLSSGTKQTAATISPQPSKVVTVPTTTPRLASTGPAPTNAVPTPTETWSGQVYQVGRASPFPVSMSISAKGVEIDYPERNCSGVLNLAGTYNEYSFYVEKITKGAFDRIKKSGCVSGAIVTQRVGTTLIWGWTGSNDGLPFVVYGTLGTPAPSALTYAAASPRGVATANMNGLWSGQAQQINRDKPFAVKMMLSGDGGQIEYADSLCSGTLSRVGSFGDYFFFAETIAKGRFDAARKTGCLPGIVIAQRSGATMTWGWVGSYERSPVIVYARLNQSITNSR